MLNNNVRLSLLNIRKGLFKILDSVSFSNKKSVMLLDILNGSTKNNTTTELYQNTFTYSFEEEVCEIGDYVFSFLEKYSIKPDYEKDYDIDYVINLIDGLNLINDGLTLLIHETSRNPSLKNALWNDIIDEKCIYSSPFKRLGLVFLLENFNKFRNAYLNDIKQNINY